jgi:hypothetical protein
MWMVLLVDDGRRELSYRGRMPYRLRIVVALVGTVLVVAYAIVGSLQVLVWNPLAAVPGLTLSEIHAELDRVGQSFSATPVILWAVLGVSAATLLALSALRPNGLALSHIAFAYSLLLVGGAPSLFFVAFLPGMQLADGFGITGGDHSLWARPLYSTSFLAMIMAIATAGLAITTSRRRAPDPQAHRDV